MKLRYLAGEYLYEYVPGVKKKIENQIKEFNSNGINAEWYKIKKKPFIKKLLPFSSPFIWKNAVDNSVDVYYIRWEPTNYEFISLLRKIKKTKRNAKIILEFGMYPYYEEIKHLNYLTLIRDRLYKNRIKEYVDVAATYTGHKEILGMKAIGLVNPIKVDDILIPHRTQYRDDSIINILAVASIEYYYGYDRLLKGIANYYNNKGSDKVVFHLVGKGGELGKLTQLVDELEITQYVIFYGFKTGKDLDEIYEIADIGIDGLGGHRKGDIWFGTLKSREYMCKGLPFVTEYILPQTLSPINKYILKVPADETDIDVQAIVNFFKVIKNTESREETIKNMREFSYSYCDTSVAMKPIIDYIKGGE